VVYPYLLYGVLRSTCVVPVHVITDKKREGDIRYKKLMGIYIGPLDRTSIIVLGRGAKCKMYPGLRAVPSKNVRDLRSKYRRVDAPSW
jgi:hypothetical protein